MKFLETLERSIAQAQKLKGYEVKFVEAAYDLDFNAVRWYFTAKKKGKGFVSVEFGKEDYQTIKEIVSRENTIVQ